jgi:hypothetical protein
MEARTDARSSSTLKLPLGYKFAVRLNPITFAGVFAVASACFPRPGSKSDLLSKGDHAAIILEVRLWPICEVATRDIEGRSPGHSGPDLLTASFSDFDANLTFGLSSRSCETRWPVRTAAFASGLEKAQADVLFRSWGEAAGTFGGLLWSPLASMVGDGTGSLENVSAKFLHRERDRSEFLLRLSFSLLPCGGRCERVT